MSRIPSALFAPLLGLALVAASPNCKNPQTQADINVCAGLKLQASEKAMQRAYQQLLSAAKSTKGAVAKIEAAQAAWIRYRDAMIDAAFPLPDKQLEYGTIYPTLYAGLRQDLTDAHTKELKFILKTQYSPH